jgi:hypothetical protein
LRAAPRRGKIVRMAQRAREAHCASPPAHHLARAMARHPRRKRPRQPHADEIRRFVEADSLAYLSLQDLRKRWATP